MPIPQLRPVQRHFQKGWKDRPRRPWRARTGKVQNILRRLFSKKGWRAYLLPGILAFIVLFGFFLIGAYAWIGRELPDPDRIADRDVAESTKIFARDGTTLLYEVHGEEKRTVIPLDRITSDMKWATISIEDQDFYQHSGFDIRGLFRSIFKNVFTGSKVGGSTITQQLVKNAILSPEKTYTRKFKELILSFQLERRFSKDEILQLYFNEIPYGSNAYGVESAALTFFGKHAVDLTLAQSALLAALPQAPSYYSPYGNHTDDLIARAHHVIDRMLDEGFISAENAEKAKAEDILSQVTPRGDNIRAPHFVIWVREQLAEKYGEDTLERGGLQVITTIDPAMQGAAETAIADQVGKNVERYNANNAALVAIDPKTGQILAMVGSKDYFDTENDGNVNVALRVRNPGSSFKPFVYATAFERGYTPDTTLFDLETNFGPDGSGKPYIPKNYDNGQRGPLTMRKALAGSLNIPAVKTLYLAGIPNTLDMAERAGYTTLGDRDQYGLALALGGGGVKLIEHTAAFSTLAGDGKRHNVVPILKVMDRKGTILEEFEEKEPAEVMSQNAARMITSILSDNEARSFIFGGRNFLTLGGRPVAAKTGTTNDFRDAWTIGFTPSLVAGVWVGNNDNSEMRPGADGSVIAAPIWNSFMRTALGDSKVESFPAAPKTPDDLKPILRGSISGAEPVLVDRVTKKRIPDSCRDSWPEAFRSTVELNDAHTILHYVVKEDPRGDAPEDPKKDPLYASWEAPVRAWAEKNGYITKPPAEESCNLRAKESAPTVTITAPDGNTPVTESSVLITASVQSAYALSSTTLSLDGTTQQTQALQTTSGGTTVVSFTLPVTGISSGFHTITITVSDVYENSGTANGRINIVGASGMTVYFVSPSDNLTVSSSDFPLSVQAYAAATILIQKVELIFRTGGGDTVVATASSPSNGGLTLVWQTPPSESGRLFLNLTTESGQSLSDFVDVTLQ